MANVQIRAKRGSYSRWFNNVVYQIRSGMIKIYRGKKVIASYPTSKYSVGKANKSSGRSRSYSRSKSRSRRYYRR